MIMKTVIKIDNLTEPQIMALEDMLATWVQLGSLGASRWTAYFADGDGNFRPKITIDGRKPEKCKLVSEEQTWGKITSSDIYKIDFDWIAWKLTEQREGN
jgi:hypothetical protein